MVSTQTEPKQDAAGEAAAIGSALGTALHRAPAVVVDDDPPRRAPLQHALRIALERTEATLDADQRTILRDELRFQQLFRFEDLPMAAGCLVRQRARAVEERPDDAFVQANDCPMPRWHSVAGAALALLWDEEAWHQAGAAAPLEPDLDAYAAFLGALDQHQPLTPIERGASPVLLRLACALRAVDLAPCGQSGATTQDPASRAVWVARLQQVRALSATLPRLWPGAA